MGRVINYIRPKSVQNWRKNPVCKRGQSILYSVAWLALVEMVQDFSLEFAGNRTKLGLKALSHYRIFRRLFMF